MRALIPFIKYDSKVLPSVLEAVRLISFHICCSVLALGYDVHCILPERDCQYISNDMLGMLPHDQRLFQVL